MVDFSNDIARNLSRLAVAFVPMLLAMVLHEVAHGYTAYRLGDPTAKIQGRLTLNPLAHLDVTGSLLFIITALMSPFIFGWAKPVPVQPRYFKNPRQGMMLVSFAGPAANFALALVFGGLYSFLVRSLLGGGMELTTVTNFLLSSTFMGIWVNLTLGFFNLLPIPSLDGGHILVGLLPPALAQRFHAYGKYWLIILVVLLGTKILPSIMSPLLSNSISFIGWIFSIPPRLLFL